MKKYLIIILFFSFITTIQAKEVVSLNKCVDGDTAWFNWNEKTIKARFLAIDSPESTNKIEPYGKEASKFTCDLLKKANKIEIEFDENSNLKDKYDRYLVWVFVDNELLQKNIIENGLAKVAYLYGDYKYTEILKNSEKIAQENKIGIWNNENNQNKLYIPILALIIIIIIIKLKRSF